MLTTVSRDNKLKFIYFLGYIVGIYIIKNHEYITILNITLFNDEYIYYSIIKSCIQKYKIFKLLEWTKQISPENMSCQGKNIF